MENLTRLFASIDSTTWTTCERCGNDYPADSQQCGRCGNTSNPLGRLASLADFAYGKRGVSRRKRSRGAYPGLAENALRFDQQRKKRATRMALICAIAAGALAIYVFVKPHLSGIESEPRELGAHTVATGAVIQSKPASAPGTIALPIPQSPSGADKKSSVETTAQTQTQTQNAGDSDFYRALQSRNLTAAHRRLAELSRSNEAGSQLEQMRADLASREHLRDVLLRRAWLCRTAGDWQCVSENTTQASAVDMSSGAVKHLVSQVSKKNGSAE